MMYVNRMESPSSSKDGALYSSIVNNATLVTADHTSVKLCT